MDLQHVNIKIFVEGELTVDLDDVIKVFHELISQQALPGVLLDVGDYRHVPAGPSVFMVGPEADYCLDNGGHRYFLLYRRKAPLAGSNEDRLRQAFDAAFHLCQLLESKFPTLKFSRREFQIIINDRGLAPNTPETLEAAKPAIESFLNGIFDNTQVSLEPDTDPRRRFAVAVKSATDFALPAAS